MKLNTILLSILVILVIILLYQHQLKQENITSDSGKTLSDEALQNIASVYNNKNMILTNLNVTSSFNLLPRGCIIAFNDQKAPDGWALCDGAEYTAPNGDKVKTPDLRGRFIRMAYNKSSTSTLWGDYLPINVKEEKDSAGTSSLLHNSWSGDNKTFQTAMMNHNFGEYGGSDWRVQSVNQLPSHTHDVSVNMQAGWNLGHGGGGYNTAVNGAATFTSTSVGSNWSMGIMPPYYVLTYIMKL